MNKNKIILNIILFSIIILIGLINIYINIKQAEIIDSVFIEVDATGDAFNSINAFRVSPGNNEITLIKDNKFGCFYSERIGYFKKIKISLPSNLIDKINFINIKIGKKNFNFDNENIKNKWKIIKNDENVELYAPQDVYSVKSKISIFKNIINWKGDFYTIYLHLLESIFFAILFIGLFNIILFYIQKRIPEKIEKEDYFDILNNSKNGLKYLFKKVYKNDKDEYYLNNDVSICDKIDLYFLTNKKIYNYYILFWFIFSLIFIFAFIQRFTLNHFAYLTGDIWGYLGPAVIKNDTGEFAHIHGRSFPYPLFIYIILEIFKDLSYITIIQHIIGILSGIILYIIWKDIFKSFLNDYYNRFYYRFFGLLLIALYLFCESNIILEHYILRESIYQFIVLIQIFLLIKFIIFIKNKSNYLYLTGILFFINNYFLFIYQPRWGLNILFNIIIYIVLFFKIKNNNLKKILLLLVLPVIISFILIYLPEKMVIKNKTATETFLHGHLLFGHAKIIDIEFKKDIDDKSFNSYNKEILIKLREYFKEVLDSKKGGLTYIGYEVNKLIYGKANNYLKNKLPGNDYNKFCRYYFLKAVFNHPFEYIKKVLLELSLFYNFNGSMYPDKKAAIDREIYTYSYNQLPDYESNYLVYKSYKDSLEIYKDSYYDFNKINFPGIDALYLILSRLYIFCLICFVTLFIINILLYNKYKRNKTDFIIGIIIIILYLYNFFINLTSSLIYSLDVGRYIYDQFVIVLLSQYFSLFYIIQTIYKFIDNKKFKDINFE